MTRRDREPISYDERAKAWVGACLAVIALIFVVGILAMVAALSLSLLRAMP